MASPPLVHIALHSEAFDPWPLLEQWQQQQPTAAAAESLFVGRVRASTADGAAITALELEHYPGMTEQQLQRIAADCCRQHGALAALVHHRIGRVQPGQAIVLVAVTADRRGAAQRGCQALLEALKHEAPFWKREWREDGRGLWLTGNTPL